MESDVTVTDFFDFFAGSLACTAWETEGTEMTIRKRAEIIARAENL
jgi:hypothetical protein